MDVSYEKNTLFITIYQGDLSGIHHCLAVLESIDSHQQERYSLASVNDQLISIRPCIIATVKFLAEQTYGESILIRETPILQMGQHQI